MIYAELTAAARYRGTVTYGPVASFMGLPTSGSYMGLEVGKVLGEISEDEHNQGRPMLSAVAVSVKGSATGGFFTLATELGKLQEEAGRTSERDGRGEYKPPASPRRSARSGCGGNNSAVGLYGDRATS